MRCWGLFYDGGPFHPCPQDHAEAHASLTAAELAFRQLVHDPTIEDPQACRMLLYRSDPGDEADPIPTWELTVSPRSALRRTRLMPVLR